MSIRGEDHVTNSGAQIQIFRALGRAASHLAHLPLLVDATGGGLSKRTGSLWWVELRERGIEALAVSASWRVSAPPIRSTGDVARRPGRDRRFRARRPRCGALSPKTSSPSQCAHAPLLPYAAVRDRCCRMSARICGRRARQPHDAGGRRDLADIVNGSLVPLLEDPSFLEEAAARLPAEPWTDATGRNGRVGVGGNQAQRPRAVPSVAAGTDGTRDRPGDGELLPLIGRAKLRAPQGQTA